MFRSNILFVFLFSHIFLSFPVVLIICTKLITKYLSPAETHKIFLNFRGEDVRLNFLSHLVDAFERHGINFFIDVHEQKGKDLKNLFVRIEDSSIAIALFSPRYPESKWCMDELVKMKKLVVKKKLIVIPIFYKVQAKDVRNLKGEFGENFYKLAKANPDRITKWKDALQCICNKMGMSLPDRSSEADFVKEIVKEVQRVLEAIRLEEEENLSVCHLGRKTGNIGISAMVSVTLIFGILGLLWFMICSK